MDLSRRRLLEIGLGGSALLAVGGIGLGMQPSVLVAPSRPLLQLDELEYSILHAIANRICPGGDGVPSAADLDVAHDIDKTLTLLHPAAITEFKSLLRLVENALPALFLDGRPRPFTASSPESQDATLRSWQDSRMAVRRGGAKVLRAFCSSTYYGNPRSYRHVGYPGPPDFSAFKPRPSTPPPETGGEEGAG